MSDDFAPADPDQATYITWDDVGRIETPGRVTVKGRSFQVEQHHIAMWHEYPSGSWSLREVPSDCSSGWVLSSFFQPRDNV